MKSQKIQKLVDKQNEEFRPIIRKIFEDSKGRLGARPIRAKMHEMGYEISVRRINYLMKEMNLSAVVPKPDAAYMHPRSKFYRNKLSRNFDQTEANKVWASDITYVPVRDQFYYVCVILDFFSESVILQRIIEFYNEGRPHRKLNMKTPTRFEVEYFSALNTK